MRKGYHRKSKIWDMRENRERGDSREGARTPHERKRLRRKAWRNTHEIGARRLDNGEAVQRKNAEKRTHTVNGEDRKIEMVDGWCARW